MAQKGIVMKKCWFVNWDSEDDLFSSYSIKNKVFLDREKAQEYCKKILGEKSIPHIMFVVPDKPGMQLKSGTSERYLKCLCLEVQE